MFKKNFIFLFLILLILFVISVFIYRNICFLSTDDAQIQGHTFMISPQVNGVLTAVNVKEGQFVRKGTLLLKIDEREFLYSLKEAKAHLESVQARWKETEANFYRSDRLLKSGATTKQQYDNSAADYHDLKSQLDLAKIKVEQAQLNLDHTSIFADSDGFIAKKSAEVGQYVNAGIPLIGFVVNGARWVVANFKETDLKFLTIKKPVDIEIDALSGSSFQGEIESIYPATGSTFTLLPPDNASGNFTKVVQRVPVLIQLNHLTPEDFLRLQVGLSVSATVKK